MNLSPHSDYKYNVGPDYDRILSPLICKLSNGKNIGECFGLFAQKVEEPKVEEPNVEEPNVEK